MIYPRNYAVWDLETSGLDPETSEILEFACIKVVNGQQIAERSFLVNHTIDIPEEAARIHGITREMCEKDGLTTEAAALELLAFFRDNSAFVTHNGLRFDNGFMLRFIGRFGNLTGEQYDGFKRHLEKNSIDTAVLYKAGKLKLERKWNESFGLWGARTMNTIVKGLKYNVGHCCDEMGIDRSQIQQHRALGDVVLTNEIYKKLTV